MTVSAGGAPDRVAAALADLAGAALEAALVIARHEVQDADDVRLAVIAMGKTGGRELNYVSDVDVIFVGGGTDALVDEIGESRVIDIATRLAVQTMRGISGM